MHCFLDVTPSISDTTSILSVSSRPVHQAKETISKVKRQPSDWEKITANETTDKGLLSKNVFKKGQNPLLFISFLVTHCETPKTCGNIHPLIYYQCLGAIVIIISTVHPVQKLNICQNLISAEILILNTTFVNYDQGKR